MSDRDLLEALRFQERHQTPPLDLARVAAIVARFSQALPAPVISTPSASPSRSGSRLRQRAEESRREAQERLARRSQATQPQQQTPPDASTYGEIGASIHDIIATAAARREAERSERRAERIAERLQDAAQGVPPVSLADTLNTVLGTAAQAYGSYAGVKVANANARAAARMGQMLQPQNYGPPVGFIGAGGQTVPAVYDPGMTTAAGIPPAVLSAIQRFMAQGGAAGVGAGLGAGIAQLLPSGAPAGGGGGGMILRPGDSVDSLYATRTANAAPSFFATQDANGRLKWYRSAGRPILWSGDLAAARRVSKVAARASRGRGRPRFLRRRRR